MILKRSRIQIKGIVQGVGFRPFVYALAEENALKGNVSNNAAGVFVDVEGEEIQIEQFIQTLKINPPPLSSIESINVEYLDKPARFADFSVTESSSNGSLVVPISADSGTCQDCIREMFDPNDRRFRYPFINCTNCGPRFTIVESVPYDRAKTTMRDFEMCAACQTEYEDPSNRRFHAEPTCCSECGPRLTLVESPPVSIPPAVADGSAIESSRELLKDGKILAIKGIGGYHLVCDAIKAQAVETLRRRKFREDKPFALMANSVNVIEKYCFVSVAEKNLLSSAERPIVLLDRRPHAQIPDAVAPRIPRLGFMLPYTPLHYLLFENRETPLVMTSGNISDEPIAYKDRDAFDRLDSIADYYLTHDRRIHIRMDDSVVMTGEQTSVTASRNDDFLSTKRASRDACPPIILRRSRGYAPAPIRTSFKFDKQILACGAELKNTFCLSKDNYAFVSHHIGDLENLETLASFTEGIEHYKRLFNVSPQMVAYDLHPEYLSTKYALACDEIDIKIGVQHHHAHIASCMADNDIEGEVIGVAMDGLGFGTDGKMWGGEFFVADFKHFERIAHLDYIPMPGGAKAIREPWRMAATYLQRAAGNEFFNLDIPFVKQLDRGKWTTLASMIASETNCPQTSSMGRLFDAISALLGVRSTVNYEGQAAIELEAIADGGVYDSYHFAVEQGGIIRSESVIAAVIDDLLNGKAVSEISGKFHLAVAKLIVEMASQIRDGHGLNRVALSGGVFQNRLLLNSAVELLRNENFEVYTHRRVPTNDGGISFGQAAIANASLH